VDGTGCGPCPMAADFSISDLESCGSASRKM
jgi:hypothetical protein